ncbi:hypothetical protein GCM10017674_54940 [Streptomyces gardneri]|uniref:Uncharacterized protein n=1 Tax=Streptomyces gardneri TaxID=66892 RepID=A0A4Y3RF10_9ACTN|nr:hypothetical protein SGA01_10930 [Streptomyces gardneri]GHH10486.1 hypothetical protein GCM10017674_54940 [Streptomyces gardneri]
MGHWEASVLLNGGARAGRGGGGAGEEEYGAGGTWSRPPRTAVGRATREAWAVSGGPRPDRP